MIGGICLNREVCGLNIHYIEEGEGPLVVLLHGWGSNIELFQPTVDLLKNNYKVVTMDMPGFGQSEEPDEPWDVDRYVDFLLAFLEPYHPDKVILLGHSFGGRVIIKLCARDLPFKVEKVILVDSAGVLPVKSPWEKFKQKLIRLTKWFFQLKLVQKLFPHLLETLRRSSGSADYNAASPLMRQTLVKVVNEDLCDLMPHIVCPTLLIWGTADTATPFSDAVKMNELMPESAIVRLEGAGHYSFLERQEQYLRVLASFFNVS
jgi:pimeloyl-ACP methyl ester carboxylesterase